MNNCVSVVTLVKVLNLLKSANDTSREKNFLLFLVNLEAHQKQNFLLILSNHKSSKPQSDQTHFLYNFCQNSPYKVLNFPKAFTLKPKVNAVPGKLRFIRRLWMGNLIIHIHWVSQLEIFFHRTISITISYKSLHTFESKVRGGEDRTWRYFLRFTAVKGKALRKLPRQQVTSSCYWATTQPKTVGSVHSSEMGLQPETTYYPLATGELWSSLPSDKRWCQIYHQSLPVSEPWRWLDERIKQNRLVKQTASW